MNGNPMQFLMQMLSGGNNPQQIVQNMVQNNPQMNAILSQAKQSGMSMEQYVRQYAKQRNIDIQPMLNMLNKKGIKY